jgi:mono/diheme cytochrome c family protein
MRHAIQSKRLALVLLTSSFGVGCFGSIDGNDNAQGEPADSAGGPGLQPVEPPPLKEPAGDENGEGMADPKPTPPSDSTSPLEAQALGILEANCSGCHTAANQANINYITNKDMLVANGKVIEGDAENSPIFIMMSQARMPPPTVSQRLTSADIEIVRLWIEGLAQVEPCKHDGGFVSFDQVYASMARDILTADLADRPFIRYLSVVNAYNSGACGAALEREQYALFKTINSVSTEAAVVPPEAIDSRDLIYRIDIRDYGWDRAVEVQPGDTKIEVIGGVATAVNSDPRAPLPFDDAWDAIVNFSAPYGVEFSGEDADFLKAQTDTLVPYLPVDAFIAAATTQNLYYTLIDVPQTLGELFLQLGIDQADQIERNIAQRAGFSNSGVSKQERSVMRFEINQPGGYFWASFDFADNGRRNESIYAEPLAADAQAAGGEFIYSLPNGMMGFYVAANDGNGSRLTEAPVDVVVDPGQVKNNGAVTNGVSCNSCHQRGIFPFTDKVREWVVANPLDYEREIYQAVMDLYPTNDEMMKVVKADSQYFQANLEDTGVPVELSDPVTRLYLDFVAGPVQKARAAADLGVQADFLQNQMARLDGRLRPVLTQGIDRELFDVLYVESLCALQTSAKNQPVGCP